MCAIACGYIGTLCVPGTHTDYKRAPDHLQQRYGVVSHPIQVLENESEASPRTTSVLNHWEISLAKWFPTFPILWHLSKVPHVVVTSKQNYFSWYFTTIILLLLWIVMCLRTITASPINYFLIVYMSPNMKTRFELLEPTWWKEITDSHKLSSEHYIHAQIHTSMLH